MGKLNGTGGIICRGLELWVRNPVDVWGWLGQKRNDLKVTGRHLTNREVYNYFKDCIVVKSHKIGEVVGGNCVSLEFMKDLAEPNSEVFQEKTQIAKEGRRTHKFRIRR